MRELAIVTRMRAELTAAMKRRDRAAMAALREGLAALENSAAPPIDSAPPEVRGTLEQHERIELTVGDAIAVIDALIADREHTVAVFEANDKPDEADALRAEVAILRSVVT